MSQQAPATIKVLPARLANQIAAGEVVERPASVLKELLENSIDAGATQVDIDIEKGGHKKIKITDNGSGIAKAQLMLALSRHATSKVSELDDLENINTLGFRGEALASISSVSRLTLTSRTAAQSEAWQARTEGRDMQVNVEPAAHPQGTSVEVLDLFFNTPARRKFLRTEKTEFNHIEELFNRIALSRHDVGMRLKHNGKLLKNLPAIMDGNPLRRIKQLCGASICDGLLQVEGQYQGFRLHGWVSGPGYHRSMSDIQYVFVNNRMMRDKLIFHAVRQAYEGLLPQDKFPYFVLYLDVPCSEVDVNVHPAKHEVRFHQSRLVHDFIFSVLNDAFNNTMQPKPDTASSSDGSAYPPSKDESNAGTAQTETELKPHIQHNYGGERVERDVSQPAQPSTDYIAPLQPVKSSGAGKGNYRPEPAQHIKEAASQYTRLMTVPVATGSQITEPLANTENLPVSEAGNSPDEQNAVPDLDSVPQFSVSSGTAYPAKVLPVKDHGLLINWQNEYYFLPYIVLIQERLKTSLSEVSQPLLLPVSAPASGVEFDDFFLETAMKLSIELQWTGKKLILKKVPANTREQNWQAMLNELIDGRASAKDKQSGLAAKSEPETEILRALAGHWTFSEAVSQEKASQEKIAFDVWHQMNQGQQQALLASQAVTVPLANWLTEQCS